MLRTVTKRLMAHGSVTFDIEPDAFVNVWVNQESAYGRLPTAHGAAHDDDTFSGQNIDVINDRDSNTQLTEDRGRNVIWPRIYVTDGAEVQEIRIEWGAYTRRAAIYRVEHSRDQVNWIFTCDSTLELNATDRIKLENPMPSGQWFRCVTGIGMPQMSMREMAFFGVTTTAARIATEVKVETVPNNPTKTRVVNLSNEDLQAYCTYVR